MFSNDKLFLKWYRYDVTNGTKQEICLSCFLTPNYWQMSGQTFFSNACLFWVLQDTEIQLLCSYLHSWSYITKHGLIIYIAHMSPTLVSKKISVLFKKPKKWNAHLVGINGKRLCRVFWHVKLLSHGKY